MAGETALRYYETPAFAGIEHFAISFVFELHVEARGRRYASSAQALRLESVLRALDPDAPDDQKHKRTPSQRAHLRALQAALFEPVASFYDDITSGAPGRGGRPLAFLASPPASDEGAARNKPVTLLRPPTWRYRAEGVSVEMSTPENARAIACEVRDSFFVFESGRIYYVLSMIPADGARLDEYALLQLMKLVYPHFGTLALRDAIRFAAEDGEHTLQQLVARRFEALKKDKGEAPNGYRDVLASLILAPGEEVSTPGWADLFSAVVGVDDDNVLAACACVEDARDCLRACGAEPLERGEPTEAPMPHVPPDYPTEGARALALAGLLQSVPDFPFQDSGEIWDSTRAAAGGKDRGYTLYSHPKFLFEVASGWRSLAEGREGLGHCPYLLLTWIVAAHDEAIAREMEEALDVILYGAEQESLLRAEPLRGLARTLKAQNRLFLPGPSAALRDSLERRIDVFRRLSIHRSRHIFRYETEARTLEQLNERRGTTDRFNRATEILDRYESLVEDVQEMGRMASDRRLNMFLAIVAGFSVVSALADVAGLGAPLIAVLAGLGLAAATVLVWIVLTKTQR